MNHALVPNGTQSSVENHHTASTVSPEAVAAPADSPDLGAATITPATHPVRFTVAWIAFAICILFVTIDIVRWNITGLFLLGVIALAVWVWGIGGLRRDFWGLA